VYTLRVQENRLVSGSTLSQGRADNTVAPGQSATVNMVSPFQL